MVKKTKALGRGLDALIPSFRGENTEGVKEEGGAENLAHNQVVEVALDQIEPNKYQPRTDFAQESLEELAASIKEHGVVQPVVLRQLGPQRYQLVAGERRWRACKLAGLATIPAIIKTFSDQESSEIALIENIQREDLNPLEEANAYKILIEDFGLTQEELSKKVGKSRSYIANTVRLLNLPQKIKDWIAQGLLSAGHGRALLPLPEPGQLKLAEKIIQEGLTVRETEMLVKSLTIFQEERENQKKIKKKEKTDPELLDMEEKLKQFFGTKVKLINKKNRGKIEIEYYSLDELNRIMELLHLI